MADAELALCRRKNNKMTLGSLFDGIGGFPFCAALSGVTPIWAAEVDPACVAVTKQRFPNIEHLGDVSKINGAKIPPVDIITFGSPCQDLSVAGERKGLKHVDNGSDETTRSGLFIDAIRIVYEMREATNGRYPTYIVWENVEGAFNSCGGRDFQTVLEKITKTDIPVPQSGKWAKAGVVRGRGVCAAWRLLDAQYWGVPQRRKRIYLIGSFGSDSSAEILFKYDSVQRYLAPRKEQAQTSPAVVGNGVARASKDNARCLTPWDCQSKRIFEPQGVYPCLQAMGDGGANNTAVLMQNVCYDARGNGDGIISPTITGDHNSRITDYTTLVMQSAGFCGQNSITAVAKGPGAVAYKLYLTLKWIVRRLTPRECERLQGYPDDWTVLPKISEMSDEDYEFYKAVFMLDKSIRGKATTKEPDKKKLIRWYNGLDNDGARYRMLGNSLAIPCALRVIGYIADYERRH